MEKVLSILNSKIKAVNKHSEISNAYRKLQTDEERVIFTFNVMIEYDIIPKVVGDKKNVKDSKTFREMGNKTFVTSPIDGKKCVDALILYTKSIAYAPSSSQELALAYANRSAVLLKMRKYTECIKDIDRALKFDYPENLRAKLYVRKTECLVALGKTDIIECYNEALYWLDKLSIEDSNKEKLKSKLDAIYGEKKILDTEETVKPESIKQPLPTIGSCNTEVPCASDAIAVKYNKQFGRHVTATRDINPGEIIAIEKPYSLILTPHNIQTHCFNCLEVSWANIPCNHCTFAMYCSEECQAVDWVKFHDIECSVFPILHAMDFGKLDLFSLRLTVQAIREANTWQELKTELAGVDQCNDPRIKGFSEDGTFYSHKYRSLYSLVTNTEKRSVPDLFRRSLDTCFILYFVATLTKMFGSKLSGDLNALMKNDFVTFFGGLILRHQQLIPSNIHSFSEEQCLDSVERGVAAMPFLSLFNHSCDPNILRHSRSDVMIIYVLYPIKKDEQIFDNYGQHYALSTKPSRQAQLLKQYYFICTCTPCREEWPQYLNLRSFKSIVKKPEDKAKIKKALRKFNIYVDLATNGDVSDKPYIIKDLLMMIQVLYKYAPLPCEEMNNVIETIKRVYDLSGNRFEIPVV